MAIKFDTFKTSTAGASDVTSVNGEQGDVIVTLDSATDQGATTTNSITVGGLSVGTAYSLPTADGTPNQSLITDGSGNLSFATLDFTGGLEYKGTFNATAGTPSLANAEQGDYYKVDTAGTIYGQTWAVGDSLLINADMGGTITNSKIDKIDNTESVTSVNSQTGAVNLGAGDLSDVTITGAVNGEVLKYNGAAWVDANVDYTEVTNTPTNVSTFTNDANYVASGDNVSVLTNDAGYLTGITGESIGSLSDVTVTSAVSGEVLSYNGTNWVNSASSGGGYTVSNQGSSDFTASNNTFYYVNTASGTTTTVTLPGRTFSATDERIKFFNHGNGTLRVQETSGTARIHPDESGNDSGGSGQTYKDIGSRSVIEFLGIPNTYNWEWAISAQLELGKDTLSADGEVLRYNSSSDQMIALPYTFPTADGTPNQILKTDGAGALTFIDQPSGTAPDVITDTSGTNTTISTTTGIEEVHLISNGANNVAITIPAASTAGEGYKYQVKRLGTGTVSVAPSSGTIDGAASFSLASQYDSVTLVSDNSNWFII